MNQQSICILCDEELLAEESVTVTRGMETIRKSSEQRGDGIAERLDGLSSIDVHIICRKNYTRQSSIKAVLQPSPKKQKTLRSSMTQFNFKQHCLFCGDDCDISIETKKPLARRKSIHEIRTITCKTTIANAASERDDEWGQIVLSRVESAIDLVAAEARYHGNCYANFLKLPSKRKPGRPQDNDLAEAYEKLFSYLSENDECQYSVDELLHKLAEYLPQSKDLCSEKTLKKKLEEHFGDDVIIASRRGKTPVVCFKDTGFKILNNSWYEQRSQSQEEERLRVVKAAAAIIREDICLKAFDTSVYPTSEAAFDDTSIVPETLRTFTHTVVNKTKKGNTAGKTRKCTVINHSIISATRPRSFLSMIHVGLSVYIHRHLASRHLIDLLSSIGVCASYSEARRYEASAMLGKQQNVSEESFKQFVFDNADFNIRTIDGYGTFHSMGGVMCVTPASGVKSQSDIERVKTCPPAEKIAAVNNVKLQRYSASNTKGIHNIVVENPAKIRQLQSANPVHSFLDFLWMSGSWLSPPKNPSWSGYMELVTKGIINYQTSKVITLPFVNLPPSSLDAIYTVLKFAANECEKYGQQTCFVTFDQPLYVKAVDMVAASSSGSELSSVIVRLGGFHLLMSFMGAVGYIMGGSGLKELWSLIYAVDSVEKMLNGHAYARALRAHFLTQLALIIVILRNAEIDDLTIEQIVCLHESVMDNSTSHVDASKSPALNRVIEKIEAVQLSASNESRTAALWVQYIKVMLMRDFIRAERCGDWKLHLVTIRKMLPYFHASAHLAYAKCAHLYIQQMSTLEEKMLPNEFEAFTSKGYFTVRRTDKMWAGVWTDMTIEQVLMRAMKTSGGLTRGRGMTESVVSRWVLGMPGCSEITQHFEAFCDVTFTTSEQHVELRMSRQLRDQKDVDTLLQWLMVHSPMMSTKELMSIATGVVADNTINCDAAVKVGTEAMQKILGKTFGDIQLHRKDKVLPLSCVNNSVKVREEVIPVNTMQLFNRIVCVIKTDEDFASCLEYELAPRPLSLFDEISMRKTQKSVMYDVIESVADSQQTYPAGSTVVLDGGYLLRRVIWPQHGSYSDIYSSYVTYVQKHYETQRVVIVFDGYSDAPSTKCAEQNRRAMKAQSTEILFTDDMPITIRQERFLTNGKNKARFIEGLTRYLEHAEIEVKQAVADADALIVRTAIDLSTNNNVVVVGTDVDLLILLIQLSKKDNQLYLYKQGAGKCPDKVFSIRDVQKHLTEVSSSLFFLHAMTGCDTTSALYRQGKKKAFNLLQKNEELRREVVSVFNDPTSSPDSVSSAGEKFLLALYSAPKSTTSLNDHRHKRFMKAVANCPVNNQMQLAALPPTSAAAKEHSFRVYHQVQQWLGVELPPTQWGWQLKNGNLQPVLTRQAPAPEKLLTLISCNCKSGCERSCGCKKAGLVCTVLCGHCNGNGCSNSESPIVCESEMDGEHIFDEKSEGIDVISDSPILENEAFDVHVPDEELSIDNQSDELEFPSATANPRKRKSKT
ncbi:uncharacterized protein LOC114543611 [Dendronephthya gigantea]|uniref:uncharacterized protein LOC114543611 n=1 Tax=Dendronephthya gigantea TaxID=151771 RepID=UPI00106DA374|nr:uncharacterized protein LOC114543611 [Dendronephthya gigantea]